MSYPKNKRPVHPAQPELAVKPGGENRTPAPTAPATTTADIARSQSWGRAGSKQTDNPGKNGFGSASSLNPGEKAAAATINAQGAAIPDTVLDGLIRGGVRSLDVPGYGKQMRDLNDAHDKPHRQVPTHSAMSGAAPGAKVPAKLGDTSSDHAERAAQRLKPGA